MRRDEGLITRQAMELVVEGTRPRGRPKLRRLDKVNADLKEVNARVIDAQDRVRWKSKIKVPDPRA